ncbi:MAG: hypothetical protein KKE89_10545, partial [Actinobacteria bacterium]|nr:hypothetical protein [Actinomycetota bacterium]
LVDGWDPASFAEGLDRILGDPALAAGFSAAAVTRSARFSWSATADRLLELYAGMTDTAAPPATA